MNPALWRILSYSLPAQKSVKWMSSCAMGFTHWSVCLRDNLLLCHLQKCIRCTQKSKIFEGKVPKNHEKHEKNEKNYNFLAWHSAK